MRDFEESSGFKKANTLPGYRVAVSHCRVAGFDDNKIRHTFQLGGLNGDKTIVIAGQNVFI